MLIDSHQHYWRYDPRAYPWMTEDLARLKQDFLPEDLSALLNGHQFNGAIAVQARHSLDETHQLIRWAGEGAGTNAVVGWVDIQKEDLAEQLAYLRHPLLRGFRHQVQDEANPAEWLLRPAVTRGLTILQRQGYVWDMLVTWRHLAESATFAEQHDNHWLVLDHLGKPDITKGAAEWGRQIAPLARLPHVICKLSGLVTERPAWQGDQSELRPFIEEALLRFGPSRLMFGSDWPVCLLAAEYDEVYQLINQQVQTLSPTEQASIWGETALKVYGLTGE